LVWRGTGGELHGKQDTPLGPGRKPGYGAPAVSVLGKAYLIVTLLLFVVGVVWAAMTMQENSAWVEIVLVTLRFDLLEPFIRRRYEVNLAGLIAGWMLAVGVLALLAMRVPFMIRGAALTQRRIRELEREVLELRTLPLRQEEEDHLLAAEAHIEAGSKKVMTEKIQLDGSDATDDSELEGAAEQHGDAKT